jgi:hypothetical protein
MPRLNRSSRRHSRHSSRKQRGGNLSNVLPVTTWGQWASYPGALAWSASSQAPAPLANGGLYTSPQSTGAWASQPFPATQYAMSVEAARTSGIPDVFYHQRPADNTGADFSPFVGSPITSQHYSATAGPSLQNGGKRRRRAMKTRRHK